MPYNHLSLNINFQQTANFLTIFNNSNIANANVKH